MKERWYEKGLRFKCTGCGQCCTGGPGVVWVSEKEIQEMASFLGLDLPTFAKMYLRKVGNRLALLEKRRGHLYDCIFLKEKRCQIYSVRPQQCRNFPWWIENLQSEAEWKEAAKSCEGIDHPEGTLFDAEFIDRHL